MRHTHPYVPRTIKIKKNHQNVGGREVKTIITEMTPTVFRNNSCCMTGGFPTIYAEKKGANAPQHLRITTHRAVDYGMSYVPELYP